MNDQNIQSYTNTVLLAYLNIALAELEEIFELNSIPSTNDTSAKLDVPANTTAIGFATVPALPADLKEIQRLYCSEDGQNNWIGPITKKEFLTSEELPTGSSNSFFNVWAWEEQEIKLLASIVALDLKLDYVKSLFTPLALAGLSGSVTVLNCSTALEFRVAGLATEFIEENEAKAIKHNNYAVSALERSLGISIKGKQVIATRRRPFRAAYKRRGILV